MSESGASMSGPRRRIGLAVGLGIAILLLAVALISTIVAPSGVSDPSVAHWLGMDRLGHDALAGGVKGTLTTLLVPAAGLIVAGLFGIPIGLLLARWAGPVRRRQGSAAGLLLPALVVALLLAAIAGPSELNVGVAIGVVALAPLATATRDALRIAQSRHYVESARLAGLSRWQALRAHGLHESISRVVRTASQLMAAGIGIEAALSFAGLGMQLPGPSLGLVLRDSPGNPGATIAFGLLLSVAIAAFLLIARAIEVPDGAIDAAA